jgi:chromosome segregation ATPase
MGDNAEFEKLSTLEARLAAALDRIATGLGEALPQQPAEDPGVTSSAFEEAQIRAELAEARVAELEAAIAAQQAPDDSAAHDAALARADALEVERDTLARAMAERDDELETLRAELAAALAAASAADAPDTDAIDRLTAQVADLEGKLTRLRAERAEAIAERDAARDIVEELQAAAGAGPDDRAMALRAEAQELRAINERLTRNINQLRGEHASDPNLLNKALVVELAALKAARASEAAELDRILADLGRADAGEGGHA